MYLMIDNYDSFVYNLAKYMEELGETVKLVRNDQISSKDIDKMLTSNMQHEKILDEIDHNKNNLEGIILSPGPKSPKDCGNCREILQTVAGRVPVLGVCLGHQIIGHVFGAVVRKGNRPMHGKVTGIKNDGQGLFKNLPRQFEVTRYHSLIVDDENFPRELRVDARSEDGVIMGLSHRSMPIYGVQFHPEAVLTQYGHELLNNYTKICREWWRTYENRNSQAAFL